MDQTALEPDKKSILEGALPLVEKIKRARLELLDLSTRNRLLNTPRSGKARTIEVVNELALAMYQTLVVDHKRFTFSPAQTDNESLPGGGADPKDQSTAPTEQLPQPDLELDEDGRSAAHWDGHLATRLTSAGLQNRLLDLYIDARTLQEEQGVNILYLAIGYLKWRDDNTPDVDRYAPLVLVPVVLERSNAREKFHMRWSGDDIQSNLSLHAMLSRSYGLELPEIGDYESLDIDAYLASVRTMVGAKENWSVLPNDAVLGLFSFAKFMMYRDLDPDLWNHIGGFESIPSIRGVVSDGFPPADMFDDDGKIDHLILPKDMLHVMDSDSSQSLVIHDARRGSHLLVQGPPGTGKSQTISNIIAAAVADGKSVLFVAEKMAALEVVKRRLDNVGVGVACLELHSSKANKRVLLEELRRTWELGRPVLEEQGNVIKQLTSLRDELNDHVSRMHTLHVSSQLTPYQVLGHLVRLKRIGLSTNKLNLLGATAWAPHEREDRLELVHDLAERIVDMGTPKDHPWFGVSNDGLLPNDRDRLIESIAQVNTELKRWSDYAATLAKHLDTSTPSMLLDAIELRQRASILVDAPRIGSESLLSQIWSDVSSAANIVRTVEHAQGLMERVAEFAPPGALLDDWSAHATCLVDLPASFAQDGQLADIAQIHQLLERSQADQTRLGHIFQEVSPLTLDSAQRLIALSEKAATAPSLEREALVSRIWDRGVNSIEEMVDAVEKVQIARRELQNTFREPAWRTELEETRRHLATAGGSWLRYLSGDWRRANRLVKELCVSPKSPNRETILPALDQLIAAQASQVLLRERDTQGSEVFGTHWEREKSNVEFLRGVIAWMRELRPLGSGAREQLANVADRELAVEVGRRLGPVLKELRQTLVLITEAAIGEQKEAIWGDQTPTGRVPLSAIRERTATWAAAHQRCLTLNPPHNQTVAVLASRLHLLGEARQATNAVNALTEKGTAAFGQLWRGVTSSPRELKHAVNWITANRSLLALAARTNNAPALLEAAEKAIAYANGLLAKLRDVFARLGFRGNSTAPDQIEQCRIDDLVAQLERWASAPEALPQWIAYLSRSNEARRKGLEEVTSKLERGDLEPRVAAHVFDLAYYEAILKEMVDASPELARFDGVKQFQRVSAFADLDRRRMRQAVDQVLRSHHQRLPQRGGVAGPTGILRAEMARQRRHMPIRQLMQRCAPAIQALKPVFMMSPLSVAQFLPPGQLTFDLLVIDEASQVQPVDALGSIARAKQLVIVGDERQLPPTRFFARLLADDREDDEQGATTADIESILGLCRARGLPERMLRWHYRSRHQSLIAVSNSQFYENRLFIVPSPFNSEAGMGLRLRHMPENVYDRGGSRINVDEAKIVAREVMNHARQANGMSLGVATFSTQQRRAILDELELLRRQDPATDAFFSSRPDEPFFVKSLENIQGDERDVIFISVGYGKDALGRLPMNFGPLSKEGGERRLNVLISRAKRRCEIFSSIIDADIDLERARGKGVVAFRLFLAYARTGQLAHALPMSHGIDTQSVFEQQVAASLKAHGYNVHTRIGVAGCFVDLGVIDDGFPGRYVLGIECDGASYHSARSARDRDRLRKAVLEDQGWMIHRIWNSDWFQRPQAELDRLVAAIDRAKTDIRMKSHPDTAIGASRSLDLVPIERTDAVTTHVTSGDWPSNSEKYREAAFSVDNTSELHEVPPRSMASLIKRIVNIEGPIHRSEVVVRVRSIWGLQRAGGRIQAAVDAGIDHALAQQELVLDEDFLTLPDQEIKVRDRSEVGSLTLRRADFLPPAEIDSALHMAIRENLGGTSEELVLCVSRKLGYRSTSSQIRQVIESRVQRLIQSGSFVWKGEHVSLKSD